MLRIKRVDKPFDEEEEEEDDEVEEEELNSSIPFNTASKYFSFVIPVSTHSRGVVLTSKYFTPSVSKASNTLCVAQVTVSGELTSA